MNEKNFKKQMDLEYDFICEFIKLRHELNLSQREMAKKTGVIREVIATLETNKKHPQTNTLIKLLEPFGYTIKIEKIKE